MFVCCDQNPSENVGKTQVYKRRNVYNRIAKNVGRTRNNIPHYPTTLQRT